MINFDDVTKENIKKNIIQIGHKFMIIHTEYKYWRLRIRKSKFIIYSINQESDIDKICIYAKKSF